MFLFYSSMADSCNEFVKKDERLIGNILCFANEDKNYLREIHRLFEGFASDDELDRCGALNNVKQTVSTLLQCLKQTEAEVSTSEEVLQPPEATPQDEKVKSR